MNGTYEENQENSKPNDVNCILGERHLCCFSTFCTILHTEISIHRLSIDLIKYLDKYIHSRQISLQLTFSRLKYTVRLLLVETMSGVRIVMMMKVGCCYQPNIIMWQYIIFSRQNCVKVRVRSVTKDTPVINLLFSLSG